MNRMLKAQATALVTHFESALGGRWRRSMRRYSEAVKADVRRRMEPQHPLLATAGGGLDQFADTGKRHHGGYQGGGCLTGSRDVSIAGSHRSVSNSLRIQRLFVELAPRPVIPIPSA